MDDDARGISSRSPGPRSKRSRRARSSTSQKAVLGGLGAPCWWAGEPQRRPPVTSPGRNMSSAVDANAVGPWSPGRPAVRDHRIGRRWPDPRRRRPHPPGRSAPSCGRSASCAAAEIGCWRCCLDRSGRRTRPVLAARPGRQRRRAAGAGPHSHRGDRSSSDSLAEVEAVGPAGPRRRVVRRRLAASGACCASLVSAGGARIAVRPACRTAALATFALLAALPALTRRARDTTTTTTRISRPPATSTRARRRRRSATTTVTPRHGHDEATPPMDDHGTRRRHGPTATGTTGTAGAARHHAPRRRTTAPAPPPDHTGIPPTTDGHRTRTLAPTTDGPPHPPADPGDPTPAGPPAPFPGSRRPPARPGRSSRSTTRG